MNSIYTKERTGTAGISGESDTPGLTMPERCLSQAEAFAPAMALPKTDPGRGGPELEILATVFLEMGGWLSGNALRAFAAVTPVDIERRGWVTRRRGPGRFDGEGYVPAGELEVAVNELKSKSNYESNHCPAGRC
jgi:hypothetical protein